MYPLKDKIAIVTGGSSGIGYETVRLLVAYGAKVAFCGRDAQKLAAAKDKILRCHPDAHLVAVTCDVLNKTEVSQFIRTVEQHFSGLDMLICNAGQGLVGHLEETTEDAWFAEVRLKLFSALNIIQAAKPLLMASENASIVCVNSLLSIQPEPHMIATSAARAHLLNFTHNLAHEFIKDRIRVNSILIGMIESGQWQRRFDQRSNQALSFEAWSQEIAEKRGIPMKRLGKPIEAAHALIFLASPLSSYSTGSTIDVSGGFSKQL